MYDSCQFVSYRMDVLIYIYINEMELTVEKRQANEKENREIINEVK